MKLLFYVSFWRKPVGLFGPAGEGLHFPAPVVAGENSERYPDCRLFDSFGAPVPNLSQMKSGSMCRRPKNRVVVPECGRLRSRRPWRPSLEVISEDGTVLPRKKEKERAVRKPADHGGSRPKNRVVVPEHELYKHAAASAALSLPSFAPSSFMF